MEKIFETNPFAVLDARLTNIEEMLKGINKPLQPAANGPEYLNTVKAAKFISKTPAALRQIVFKRGITSIKRGRGLYFLESDLVAWLEAGRRKTKEELSQDPEIILKKKGGKS